MQVKSEIFFFFETETQEISISRSTKCDCLFMFWEYVIQFLRCLFPRFFSCFFEYHFGRERAALILDASSLFLPRLQFHSQNISKKSSAVNAQNIETTWRRVEIIPKIKESHPTQPAYTKNKNLKKKISNEHENICWTAEEERNESERWEFFDSFSQKKNYKCVHFSKNDDVDLENLKTL